MNPRVAYLTGEFPRATDTFIQREVAALGAHGADVRTFSVRRPDPSQWVGPEQKELGAKTTYLQAIAKNPVKLAAAHMRCLLRSPGRYFGGMKLACASRSPGIKALLYQAFYFAEAALLADEMHKQGVQHLHNHFGDSSCTLAMICSEVSGVPFSFTLHGPGIFFEPERWRLDMKLNRAERVAVISHFCRSQAMIFSDPERWDRFNIVHCGIDPALFEVKQHEGQAATLVTIGRLAPVKGMHVLIEALGRLKRRGRVVNVKVIGDGPERGRLEERVKKLGLEDQVHFTGYMSQADVRENLLSADIFVSPSFAEGVPVVLMEAMAGGLPCIATRIAGVAELVEHERTGFIVSPGDTEDLEQALEKLIDDADMRNRFAVAGRKKVEREFNINTEAEKLLRLFQASIESQLAEAPVPDAVADPA